MNLPMLPDPEPHSSVMLSVVIPTLDRVETAALLGERIKELLPALKIEVIVVTPSAERPPSRESLIYVADRGHGVYAAYTVGLQNATGEYVWFMGDDDYPLDAAADVGRILETGDIDLVVAPVLFSSGRIYRPKRSLLLLHFLNWCQQGVIYRRHEIIRYRFYRRMPIQADQYVNILMRANPTIQIYYFMRPICMFGVDGVSGRTRDYGYSSLRLALAHRTLGTCAFFAFRVLTLFEPLVKRLVKIR